MFNLLGGSLSLPKCLRLLATVALLGCALTAAMRFGYALPTSITIRGIQYLRQ